VLGSATDASGELGRDGMRAAGLRIAQANSQMHIGLGYSLETGRTTAPYRSAAQPPCIAAVRCLGARVRGHCSAEICSRGVAAGDAGATGAGPSAGPARVTVPRASRKASTHLFRPPPAGESVAPGLIFTGMICTGVRRGQGERSF
jgi:hypothetical protein